MKIVIRITIEGLACMAYIDVLRRLTIPLLLDRNPKAYNLVIHHAYASVIVSLLFMTLVSSCLLSAIVKTLPISSTCL